MVPPQQLHHVSLLTADLPFHREALTSASALKASINAMLRPIHTNCPLPNARSTLLCIWPSRASSISSILQPPEQSQPRKSSSNNPPPHSKAQNREEENPPPLGPKTPRISAPEPLLPPGHPHRLGRAHQRAPRQHHAAAQRVPLARHLLPEPADRHGREQAQAFLDDGAEVGKGAGFGVGDDAGFVGVGWGGRGGGGELGLEAVVGCRVGEEEEEGCADERGDCVGAGEAGVGTGDC